jgi:hypothetical protein
MGTCKLAVVLVVALGGSISAADWPQWRGPRGTGATDEKNLPVKWSATENIAWKAAIGVAGDGKIYFVSETGETIVVKAGRQPDVLARNDLGERLIASPAISNGQLFIRSDGQLFAIGKR